MSHRKTVLIGGMGEGLGSALARWFSTRNYQVIGFSRSTNAQVPGDIVQMKVDLSDQAQVKRAIMEIDRTYSVRMSLSTMLLNY